MNTHTTTNDAIALDLWSGYRPAKDPDWFTAGKSTPMSLIRAVRRGVHPMGWRLHPDETTTCGTCKHLTCRHLSRRWFKCDLTVITGGPGTDIRKKWRGCEKWEPEEA